MVSNSLPSRAPYSDRTCRHTDSPSSPGGPDTEGLDAVVAAAGQLAPVGAEKDEIINSFDRNEDGGTIPPYW